ncbi:MAG TPA: RuBisCO large subunit C-terminal-like domain-containing protein [Myxococcota bacterium]|nr:RuBisCO large subunit C-terminal-like domain-containing protein [Myxococcota bacterium]HQP96392.1 RuBisCO large subunit C-terminal-like domain-containing protein [Myxococcota bacterium]
MARFSVLYSLAATDIEDAARQAFEIAVEQTIEFPYDLVTNRFIRDEVTGKVESVDGPLPENGRFRVLISYDEATCDDEFTQFLNVVFGNTSMKPGVRVESINPTVAQLAAFRGPGFGVQGIRDIIGVRDRPLLCSAIKPMGLDTATLAGMAYRFALGGIDFIKDDHGLADQRLSRFEDRISACMKAVERANRETGRRCLYIPNVTADGPETLNRARFARGAGASAVIVSGALTGLSMLRAVATDPDVSLPVFYHPAFGGTYTVSETSGMSQRAYYGQLLRLACADAVIFPSFGGRFTFNREQCAEIVAGCREDMPGIRPSLPAPGGGMNFGNIPESIEFYGSDVIFLIGGGLFRHDPDITKSVADLLSLVETESRILR